MIKDIHLKEREICLDKGLSLTPHRHTQDNRKNTLRKKQRKHRNTIWQSKRQNNTAKRRI